MAAREPIEPRREPDRTESRTDYTVIEHRSNAGFWAFIIVLVLLAVAAVLYTTGVFNGRPLSTETNKVNIKVNPPTSGGGGNTGGGGQ